MLKLVGVADAQECRPHDLRRGHNQDLVDSGVPLLQILIFAGWRAPGSHVSYTDLISTEMQACLKAHDALISDSVH